MKRNWQRVANLCGINSENETMINTHTPIKSECAYYTQLSTAVNEVDVSILSLFKCVCRIILTSCTLSRPGNARTCTEDRERVYSIYVYICIYTYYSIIYVLS